MWSSALHASLGASVCSDTGDGNHMQAQPARREVSFGLPVTHKVGSGDASLHNGIYSIFSTILLKSFLAF